MAKAKPSQKVTTAEVKVKKGISRTHRNANERKCLTKASKRIYLGSDRTWFRLMLAAEKHARSKKVNIAVPA